MDVLDYALQMELDGEKYYRDLAERTSDSGLKNILTRLADAEVKHYNFFKLIKDGTPGEMSADVVRDNARTLFAEMAEDGRAFSLDEKQIELYEKAAAIERKTRDFYREKAEDIKDPAVRDTILKIADEEELHLQLLTSIVEHVAHAVEGNWLEDAEWYHFDQY